MIPLIPIVAGAALGGLLGVIAYRTPSTRARIGGEIPELLRRGGAAGTPVRVSVRTPTSYVEGIRSRDPVGGQKMLLEDIRRRVEAQGFRGTRLVMMDPTDNTRIVLLTHTTAGLGSRRVDPYVTITTVEPVEGFPDPITFDQPVGWSAGQQVSEIDPGLPNEDAATVRHALLTETCPRHLRGLASTLVPWFPVGASLLYAKADLADPHSPIIDGPVDHPSLGPVAYRIANLQALARQRDYPMDLLNLEVKRCACLLVEDPSSSMEGIPKPVVDLGRALVKRTAEGYRYIDAETVRGVCPPDGREAFVSPSALQLAMMPMKPMISGIANRKEMFRKRKELAANVRAEGTAFGQTRSDRQDLMRAKASWEKAEKSLDRRRWIEWYRRQEG